MIVTETSDPPFTETKKVIPLSRLQVRIESLRACGWPIVAAGGVFDLLHVGHVRTLQYASSHGGILIVLLNSDESVRQLKGPTRPIVPESERAEMLSALACVDYVVVFEESTPERVLRTIKPDFWIKAADYGINEIIEKDIVAEFGGRVKLAPYIEGHSTTRIMERITNGS